MTQKLNKDGVSLVTAHSLSQVYTRTEKGSDLRALIEELFPHTMNDPHYGFDPPDEINSPAHYTYSGLEPFNVISDWGWSLHFCLGNTLKYVCRAGYKDSAIKDLKKAEWYLVSGIEYAKNNPNFSGRKSRGTIKAEAVLLAWKLSSDLKEVVGYLHRFNRDHSLRNLTRALDYLQLEITRLEREEHDANESTL